MGGCSRERQSDLTLISIKAFSLHESLRRSSPERCRGRFCIDRRGSRGYNLEKLSHVLAFRSARPLIRRLFSWVRRLLNRSSSRSRQELSDRTDARGAGSLDQESVFMTLDKLL